MKESLFKLKAKYWFNRLLIVLLDTFLALLRLAFYMILVSFCEITKLIGIIDINEWIAGFILYIIIFLFIKD